MRKPDATDTVEDEHLQQSGAGGDFVALGIHRQLPQKKLVLPSPGANQMQRLRLVPGMVKRTPPQ